MSQFSTEPTGNSGITTNTALKKETEVLTPAERAKRRNRRGYCGCFVFQGCLVLAIGIGWFLAGWEESAMSDDRDGVPAAFEALIARSFPAGMTRKELDDLFMTNPFPAHNGDCLISQSYKSDESHYYFDKYARDVGIRPSKYHKVLVLFIPDSKRYLEELATIRVTLFFNKVDVIAGHHIEIDYRDPSIDVAKGIPQSRRVQSKKKQSFIHFILP
jgi:hypothetical protein